MVPAVRGRAGTGGAAGEDTTSQYSAVPGTASAALPGQAGTENGGVVASLLAGMIWDGMPR